MGVVEAAEEVQGAGRTSSLKNILTIHHSVSTERRSRCSSGDGRAMQ